MDVNRHLAGYCSHVTLVLHPECTSKSNGEDDRLMTEPLVIGSREGLARKEMATITYHPMRLHDFSVFMYVYIATVNRGMEVSTYIYRDSRSSGVNTNHSCFAVRNLRYDDHPSHPPISALWACSLCPMPPAGVPHSDQLNRPIRGISATY
jgi:hypothetical protein